MDWAERIGLAQQTLTAFGPDWISLQFVPYAFNPKGLVFGLARHLHQLFQGHQAQIMFHELWIGGAKESSTKHRLIGTVQKWLVLDLIEQLKPKVIHTSNQTYVTMLRRAGVTALSLPLFGNIPVLAESGDEWLCGGGRTQ